MKNDLFDTVFDVARRFVDFESYGSVPKAQKALQRRCPGFRTGEYADAFQKAIALLNDAAKTVKNNQKTLVGERGDLQDVDLAAVEATNADLHSRWHDFSRATCREALGWIVYWRYLR